MRYKLSLLLVLLLTSGILAQERTRNVLPNATDSYTVGTTTLRYLGGAFANLTIANITGSQAVVSGVTNITGLLTTNAIVANTTVNVTTTLTANATSFTGPMIYGRTTVNVSNGSPATLNMATCAPLVAITNITGGNVIINMVNVTAGQVVRIMDESGKLGGTGNATVNITGGTINGFDNVTLTNSSAVSSGNPFPTFFFHALTTTAGFIGK
jgi:hypothetical protein